MKIILNQSEYQTSLFKFDLKMKLSILLLFSSIFVLQANESYSQRTKVTLDLNNITVEQLIDEIEDKTEFRFLYLLEDVNLKRIVSVKVEKEKLNFILDKVFNGTKTTYRIDGRQIALVKKIDPSIKKKVPEEVQRSIKGKVTDEKGTPLPGVNILVVETSKGAISDFDGNYTVEADTGNTLKFSFVGMATKSIVVSDSDTVDVILSEDTSSLDAVVITGTSRKLQTALETSYGVAILDDRSMTQEAASGMSDLLDAVPGLYGEPAGGEVNTQLTARGVRGSFNTYISLQEDGLPVLYTPFLTEYEIRQDVTYGRLETVLGGPSGVLTAQGAAATVNFISRMPTKEEGEIRFSMTDYGRVRTDVFYGGPINDNGWYASVGGYFRRGEGVRDVGFAGDLGGQVRANLKKVFDKGDLTFSLKKIDDNTIFYFAMPTDMRGDKPRPIANFNPRDESLIGPDNRIMNLKTPDGIEVIDSKTGQESNTEQFSVKFNYDLGSGFHIKEHGRVSTIYSDGVDLRPGGFLGMATDYMSNAQTALISAFPSTVSTQLRRVNDGQIINNTDNLNTNGMLVEQNLISYKRNHDNFINDIQLSYENDWLSISGGFQYWNMETTTHYTAGTFLLDVKGQAERYDVEALDSNGNVIGHLTDQGIVKHGAMDTKGSLDTRSMNNYINAQFQPIENLWVDAGIRFENVRFDASGVDVDSNVALPAHLNNPMVLADNMVVLSSNGNVYHGSITRKEHTWTVGANYKFSDKLAAYGRYTKAHDFGFSGEFAYFNVPGFGVNPGSNLGLDGIQAAHLKFGELGVRYQGSAFSLWLTAFLSENDDYSVRYTDVNGALKEFATDNRVTGIEFSGRWSATSNLTVDLSGIIQSSEIIDNEPFSIIDGKQVDRLPNAQIRLAPSYRFNNKGRIYGSMQYYGERYANLTNTLNLGSYTLIDLGVDYNFDEKISLLLQATNLTNELIFASGNAENSATAPVGRFDFSQALPGTVLSASLVFKF